MLIFQGISPQGSAKVGRVVTIGNFDGVHCGHQALIQETCAIANREGLTATAVTFAPHPKAFFTPAKAPGPTAITNIKMITKLGITLIKDSINLVRFLIQTIGMVGVADKNDKMMATNPP
jgi:cytidyltransferase-like protein